MPVIDIYMPNNPPKNLLEEIACQIQAKLKLPPDRVWIMWHQLNDGYYYRPNWQNEDEPSGPIVKVRCKSDYSHKQINDVMKVIVNYLSGALCVSPESIFIIVDPVQKGRLFVRGQIWE